MNFFGLCRSAHGRLARGRAPPPPSPGRNLGLGRESGSPCAPTWADFGPAAVGCPIARVLIGRPSGEIGRAKTQAPSRRPNPSHSSLLSAENPSHGAAAARPGGTTARRRRHTPPRRCAHSLEGECAAVERLCRGAPSFLSFSAGVSTSGGG